MEEIFENADCQKTIQCLLQIVPSSEDWVRRKLESCYDDNWLNMYDRERQWKMLAEISANIMGQEDWKKKFHETVNKRQFT